MRKMLLTIAVAVMAALVFSCTDSKTREALSVSERVIMDRPDSALSILDSVSPDKLKGAKDRALYGLLRTMALDKNHMEIADDSLIDRSVDYFRKHSDKRRLATALYYQGRVKYLNGNQPLALVTYMQAAEAAEEIDDRFYVGMACRGISDIYCESFNAGDELEYAKREYENIKASGKQPYINYAMLDLARAHHNNENYEEVYKITEQLEDSAQASEDSYLYESSVRLLAGAYIGDSNPEKAANAYELLCREGMGCAEDSAFLTISYALLGNSEKANSMLNKLHLKDAYQKELVLCHVRKVQGRNSEALSHFDALDDLSNEMLQQKIKINMNTYVSDHHKALSKQSKKDLSKSRILLYLSIIISIITITGICLITILAIRKQKKEINDKIIFAEQLQEELKQSEDDHKKASKTIKDLLATKYELLEELCNIVLTSSDTKSARKRIADNVTNLINELSIDGNKIIELGKKIDKMYNNLYTDFKNDFPDLKEADYRLFVFSTLNFSNTAISLFLKVPTTVPVE